MLVYLIRVHACLTKLLCIPVCLYLKMHVNLQSKFTTDLKDHYQSTKFDLGPPAQQAHVIWRIVYKSYVPLVS